MGELLSRLTAGFANLSTRERLLAGAAGALLLAAILYAGVLNPVLGMGRRAEERLHAAEQELEVMKRLRREWDGVQQRLSGVEQRIARSSRRNLRTTLETLARSSGVAVESMEPQPSPAHDSYRENKVEVSLESVTLHQTVRYLDQIESAPQVLSVKSLRMRTRKDKPEYLDVTFTVSAFEPV